MNKLLVIFLLVVSLGAIAPFSFANSAPNASGVSDYSCWGLARMARDIHIDRIQKRVRLEVAIDKVIMESRSQDEALQLIQVVNAVYEHPRRMKAEVVEKVWYQACYLSE